MIDAKVVEMLVDARSRAEESPIAGLTQREREILAQIARGKSNPAIAESLGLTKRAVEKHINAIFTKLQLPESEDVSRRVTAALMFLADDPSPARDRPADRGPPLPGGRRVGRRSGEAVGLRRGRAASP